MFEKIQHAGYWVENLQAAVDWYVETFGGVDTGGNERIRFVQIGEIEVELIEPAEKGDLFKDGPQMIQHIGYVISDLDKAVADFKARGFKFLSEEPIINPVGYRLIFFDKAHSQGTFIHMTDASSMNRGRSGYSSS